jgi:hypothetical protein
MLVLNVQDAWHNIQLSRKRHKLSCERQILAPRLVELKFVIQNTPNGDPKVLSFPTYWARVGVSERPTFFLLLFRPFFFSFFSFFFFLVSFFFFLVSFFFLGAALFLFFGPEAVGVGEAGADVGADAGGRAQPSSSSAVLCQSMLRPKKMTLWISEKISSRWKNIWKRRCQLHVLDRSRLQETMPILRNRYV